MPTTRGRGDYITTGDKLKLRDGSDAENKKSVTIQAGDNNAEVSITLPTETGGQILTTTSTATLTNKTLTNPTIDGGTITADIIGNASTASKLAATKNIAIAGEVAGSADFDGSQNITIDATVVDDTIDNDNIKADAGIARTKIAAGTANQVVINDGSGVFSSEAQLAISRGGTGESTAPAAFDALSPLTTKGDILVRTGSINGPSNVRLPVGTNNYVLAADSTTDNGVAWKPAADTGVLPLAGSDTQIQYNDNGQLGASSNFTYDASLGTLFIKGINSTSSTYALEIKDAGVTTLFKLDNAGGITGSHITTASGTKLGRFAGSLNIKSSTVAIGTEAGRNNNSGTDWTAIGYRAGYSNLTRDSWTAIGSLAGEASSTGQFWTALGYAAGKANTSGSSWTAIGLSAGTANTISGNWTALGTFAGSQSIVGGDWVALGYAAGTYDTASDPLEYFEKSVYIGSGAKGTNGTSGTPTTNETVIGYNAEGNGSNTVTIGNSSVVDTHLTGYVEVENTEGNEGSRGIAFKNENKFSYEALPEDDTTGYTVAVSADGTTAAVGTPYATDGKGAVYVYKYSELGWSKIDTLTKDLGSTNGLVFGSTVAISSDGNVIIVGGHQFDNSKGGAYVFRYNGTSWVEEQALLGTDTVSGDAFGISVDISADGNIAAIGAYDDDVGANSTQGSAYIFRYNGSTWAEEQKLLDPNGASFDYFGYSVAISGDGNKVIVGATRKNSDKGGVVVFKYNGSSWDVEASFTPQDTAEYDVLLTGSSVDISADGNVAIISAPYSTVDGVNFAGVSFVYRYNSISGWEQEQVFVNPTPTSSDLFSFFTAISDDGNTIAFTDDYIDGLSYTNVYKYTGLSWNLFQRIKNPLRPFPNSSSISISQDGSVIFIGDAGSVLGNVYAYTVSKKYTSSILLKPSNDGLEALDLSFSCDDNGRQDLAQVTERARLTYDGDLILPTLGKGIILTSANGTHTKRIIINNSGALVVEDV